MSDGVYYLLLLMLVDILDACDKRAGINTFGPECQYMCHCVNGAECDDKTGECKNGCEPKWFGPGCQFRDSAFEEYSRHNSNTKPFKYSELGNDGNTSTCSYTSSANASKVKPWWRVWLPRNETIHELTLLTNDDGKDYLSSFTVTVEYVPLRKRTNKYYQPHYSNICHGPTNSSIESTSIHVLCKEPRVGNQVRIKLSKAKTQLVLCDVRINGGRNMAYVRHVNVSSRQNNSRYEPENAVDGNLTNSSWDNCFVSGDGTNNWISVDLGQQIYVTSVNSTKYNNERLKHYVIEVSNTSADRSWAKVYDDSPNDIPTTQVSLSVTARYLRVRRPNETSFTVCELQIFGRCSRSKCGYDCSNDCRCEGNERLENELSGVCSTGCSDRWTGSRGKCDIECDIEHWGGTCEIECGACNGSTCDVKAGECYNGCQVGYYETDMCTKECQNGTYGEGCIGVCGECKDDLCHKMNGSCMFGCNFGFKGSLCDMKSDSLSATDFPLAPVGGIISFVVVITIVMSAVIFWRRKRLRSEPTDQTTQLQEFGVYEHIFTDPGDCDSAEHTYERIVR